MAAVLTGGALELFFMKCSVAGFHFIIETTKSSLSLFSMWVNFLFLFDLSLDYWILFNENCSSSLLFHTKNIGESSVYFSSLTVLVISVERSLPIRSFYGLHFPQPHCIHIPTVAVLSIQYTIAFGFLIWLPAHSKPI